jgi:hypothetical protein
MHQGCVARANEGEEAAAGWWPTSPSSRWVVSRTTPASSLPTTSSTCLATVSPRLLVWRRRHRARPAGRSIGVGVPAHVRGLPPRHRRVPRPPAWSQRGAGVRRVPAADQERVDPLCPRRPSHRSGGPRGPSRQCPRGGRLPGRTPGGPARPRRTRARVRTGAAGGRVRPPDVPGGDPLLHTHLVVPTVSRARTAVGRPWTAGTCFGIGWPPTPSRGAWPGFSGWPMPGPIAWLASCEPTPDPP